MKLNIVPLNIVTFETYVIHMKKQLIKKLLNC